MESCVNQTPLPKGETGLIRIWHALHYSLAGIKSALKHEAAFRQEALLAAVLIPLALFLPASALGKSIMVASVLLVLVVELLNSTIEATVDYVSQEVHPLAKRAKDMGSAAVLLSLLNAAIVWLIILFS